MASPPLVKAILICDTVIHEAGTNKKSCIGIFHQIHAPSFPCRHGSLTIYVSITDAEGEYRFDLELVSLADGREIGRGNTPKLRLPDRLQTVELTFRLENLVFPTEGSYEFRLHANGGLLGQEEVRVTGRKPGGRPC